MLKKQKIFVINTSKRYICKKNMEQASICIDLKCPSRLECKKFSRALDVNAGKIKQYRIIEKCDFEK